MSPTRAWLLGSVVALLSASTVRPCAAGTASELRYVRGRGAEGCPGEEWLRSAVTTEMGSDPFVLPPERTVVVRLERSRGGYEATMQIVSLDAFVLGERKLTSTVDRCEPIVGAVALAISIALHHLALSEAPPRQQAPLEVSTRSPSPPAAPRNEPASTRPPARPPPDRTALAVSLGGVVSDGAAPAVAIGVVLGVGFRARLVSTPR